MAVPLWQLALGVLLASFAVAHTLAANAAPRPLQTDNASDNLQSKHCTHNVQRQLYWWTRQERGYGYLVEGKPRGVLPLQARVHVDFDSREVRDWSAAQMHDEEHVLPHLQDGTSKRRWREEEEEKTGGGGVGGGPVKVDYVLGV